MKTANSKAIEQFEDLISENALMEKTGYTKSALKHLRKTGKIQKWSTINGKKLMYSKTEIASLLIQA